MKTKERLITMMLALMALFMGTTVMAKEAYAVYNNDNPKCRVMTFYYDDQRASRQGDTYSLNSANDYPDWILGDTKMFEKVVFDPSFADARPTSTCKWFYGQHWLTTIEGFENLKTDKVTTAGSMFFNCDKLEEIDVSGWNTKNLTNTWGMFWYCNALKTLDLSSWDTSSLTSTGYMFYGCYHLQTIYVSHKWKSEGMTESENMFSDCSSLVGEKGSQPDNEHSDATYAHIDGGDENPGYLTYSPEKYNLWIAGTRVTELNYESLPVTYGTASYNPQTMTLTLNNAKIDEGNNYPAIEVSKFSGLTIEVKGSNTIRTDAACLYFKNVNLTITGPGELNLTSRGKDAINVTNSTLKLDHAKVYARGKASALNGTGSAMTVNYSLLEASSTDETQATIRGFDSFQMTNSKFEDVINGSDELFYGESFFYNAGDNAIWYAGYYYPDEGHGGQYDYDNSYPYKVKISPTKSSISTNINEAYGQRESVKGQKDEWYNLSGQRVGKDYKGIVIINGKKTVVK